MQYHLSFNIIAVGAEIEDIENGFGEEYQVVLTSFNISPINPVLTLKRKLEKKY